MQSFLSRMWYWLFLNSFASGEPFSTEEMEEMLSAAVDPEKGYVLYKDYAATMSVEET